MSGNAGDPGATHPYVLGHSDREIKRLRDQAVLQGPITLGFFRAAGVAPGMRVLDVGSGAGDVAFLAAKIVGDSGEVVGVDLAAPGIEIARSRAVEHSLRNVSFHVGDPAEMKFEQPFDAVLGRYVLQFQKDPAAMLRKLAAHLKPGGVAVFHEIDWGSMRSFPPAPLYNQCCEWGQETMRLHGTETRMGAKLHATFVAAGFPAPSMRLEAIIGGGENSAPVRQLITELIATLLPEMERLGVATASEVGIETMAERLKSEAMNTSSVFVGHHQIAAWARM